MTTALKFLRPERVGPFTQVAWPVPGTWLDSDGPPQLCTAGIHALSPDALPFWLAEELWLVELEGAQEVESGLVLARRGRLVDRVGAWNDETAREFAEACLAALPGNPRNETVRQRGEDAATAAREVTAGPSAASVAYIAAKAAEADRAGGYDEERGRQADWLVKRLGVWTARDDRPAWWRRLRR